MARPMGRLLGPGPWAGSLGPAHGPALGPAYALFPTTLVDHNSPDELIYRKATGNQWEIDQKPTFVQKSVVVTKALAPKFCAEWSGR